MIVVLLGTCHAWLERYASLILVATMVLPLGEHLVLVFRFIV